MKPYFAVVLMIASPVWADTPLSRDQFEALVAGKTLTFSTGVSPYGVEYYAPNRQVIWSFTDGNCVRGERFEDLTVSGLNICFVYENNSDPQCWQVHEDNGKIRAGFMNSPGTTVLYQAVESEPLVCAGVGA